MTLPVSLAAMKVRSWRRVGMSISINYADAANLNIFLCGQRPRPEDNRMMIRPADAGDVAAIAAIYRHHASLHGSASFETGFPDGGGDGSAPAALAAGDYPYLVAAEADEILGYAYVGPQWSTRRVSKHGGEFDLPAARRGWARPRRQAAGGAHCRRRSARLPSDGGSRRGQREPRSVRCTSGHGFRLVGVLRSVGYKHGRWLDLLLQRALGAGDEAGIPALQVNEPSPARVSTRRLTVGLGANQLLSWGTTFYLPAVVSGAAARDLHTTPASILGGFLPSLLLVTGICAPRVGRWIGQRGGRRVLGQQHGDPCRRHAVLASAHGTAVWFADWTILGAGMSLGLYDAAFATAGTLLGRSVAPVITGITLLGGLASTVGWPVGAR